MLRIIQNKHAAGAKSYYSHGDYLSEGQELNGRWGGKGAALLGLTGDVQKRDFDALCDNLHPVTGARLTARTDTDRTVGYDFNFHVPKGVSLAYAFTQDDRILDAFRASVQETMEELEAEAKTRVRTRGRDDERVTGNLCWAEFVHFTSRPVDGVPDPHLHAHCFTLNATFDAEEDRWKAGQFRDLKRDARYYEAACHARLAKRMNELGYATERRGKDWDLCAFPKSVTNKFSRRTQLIEQLAAEQDIHDPAEKGDLGAKTREKKQQEYTMSELRELWAARLNNDEASAVTKLGRGKSVALVSDRDADSQALDHAIEHCFERNSVVAKKELLTTALRRGVGQVCVEGVKAQVAQKDVISGQYRGRELITTRAVLAEEKSLLDFARQGRHRATPLNQQWRIQREWLNAGQQAAVHHVLESRDRVVIVKGRAGTGKTSLMQEAVAGIEAGGQQVFTFAPSAEASRGVLQSEGFANATTVAELLVNQDLQQACRGQVLWIDEAGLLGTRTLKRVFDLAEQNDCRVILSGDWKQHGSVERGAALRLLEQEAGLRPAIVSQNQRQESLEYRAIVDQIADGDLVSALERANQCGWIRELADGQRNTVIAHDYVASLRSRESVLVVCPTHAEGERVSRAIRHELKEHGLLGKEDRTIERLIPLHLTEAERRDAHSYSVGDVLVFHQNAPGHRKGDRVTLEAAPDESILSQSQHFQVYHATTMPVAQGEMIRVTANGSTLDGQHRLNNGSLYQVKGFTEEGHLRLGNGWVVAAQFGMVAPGYVSTSHSSQGKTVDRVLIAEPTATFGAASAEQLYVSASRGRKGMRIYTDDRAALVAAVHQSTSRASASQLVEGYQMDAELRRLQLAKAQLLSAQRSERATDQGYEVIYGK